MSEKRQNLKVPKLLWLRTYVECYFHGCLSFPECHTRGWVGFSELRKTTPIAECKKRRRRQFSVSIGNQATPCTKASPPLFTHLNVRVSCNDLCHMASTLSGVSCRICQAHSLLGHTLTHTAMHIDYDRLYAFYCHLLNAGVYIVQTHCVKRHVSALHTVRPDFCFYPIFEINVRSLYNKILFHLRFKVLYCQ